jgi:hypothetical protein
MPTDASAILSEMVQNKYSLSNRCCNALVLSMCSINAILQSPCTVAYMPVAIAFMIGEGHCSEKGAKEYCFPIETRGRKIGDGENNAFSCCLTLFSPLSTSARALEAMTGPYNMRNMM